MTNWIELAQQAADAAASFANAAMEIASEACRISGKNDNSAAYEHQRLLHGYAWIETICAALASTARWTQASNAAGRSAPVDELLLRIGFGEYLHQLLGGIAMSQNELVRPGELGLSEAAATLRSCPAVSTFLNSGNVAATRAAFAQLLREGFRPDESLDDPTLDMIREQFRSFARERIAPRAHAWHLENALIPDETIAEMADLGVFGICIDEAYGGLGLGKLAMCVVSEELSRGWICAGSLGTRSEIAGELIGSSGTPEQKARWLPRLASGEILPTAVFTEPDVGSDLAALRTRAWKRDGKWHIHGSKTWITHAARADLMTILVRTDPAQSGHRGLSMLIAEKSRQKGSTAFPDGGLEGEEIEVLGYRGMREYVLSFDGFEVDGDGLLGDDEGNGFKQLMRTFEGARIQTAARAIGVAWNAVDLALAYALERRQFGQPLVHFPRIADKLVLMIAETVMARELTYAAARAKDGGHRCDVEAGMAKLLAARVAWSNADLNVQIHGGNGYALEYQASRVFCDARILNIFEGAAEIQAQVVGRGLIARSLA